MACSEDKTKDKCATELYKEIKVNQSEKFQLDLAYTSSVLVYLISKYYLSLSQAIQPLYKPLDDMLRIACFAQLENYERYLT